MGSGRLSQSLVCSAFTLLACPWLGKAHTATLGRHHDVSRRYYEHQVQVDEDKHTDEFFSFVTRPDLDAPRWNVEVCDEEAVTPGYWLVAPYSKVTQENSDAPWNAPHIYDSNGDLVWSGAALFDGWSTFDFRVSSVQGKPMLSLIYPHGRQAMILDDTYQLHEIVPMGSDGWDVDVWGMNMHEFTTVENGTKALFFRRVKRERTTKDFGITGYNGPCTAIFDGISEWITKTWRSIHEWDAEGHIAVNETYVTLDPVYELCKEWDYSHMNSIDAFPNGDYLISSRRTSTIYRISRTTGAVVWRLGGHQSDFDLPVRFYGQHSVKVYRSNDTHVTLSLFDNAYLPPGDPVTVNNESRGLILALDTTAMTGELVQEYPHPGGNYTHSRGNMQMLPDGNAWLCWVDNARSTEHAPDGHLVMQTSFKANISSYRTYKSPWVGRPLEPPDVHSAVIKKDGSYYTLVHMSWNGATEVDYWKIYTTNAADDQTRRAVATVKKRGFETLAWTEGWLTHVVVKPVNKHGSTLGMSSVVASLPPRGEGSPEEDNNNKDDADSDEVSGDESSDVEASDDEHSSTESLVDDSITGDSDTAENEESSLPVLLLGNWPIIFALGILIGALAGSLVATSIIKRQGVYLPRPGLPAWWRRKKHSVYERVMPEDQEEVMKLQVFDVGVDEIDERLESGERKAEEESGRLSSQLQP